MPTVIGPYILVQPAGPVAANGARTVARIAGVERSHDVTDPSGVAGRASAASIHGLPAPVVAGIRKVPGTTRTLTWPVVDV